jgi:DNA adenine methylase
LECCSYDELEIPDNSIIYCDPPYSDVTGYKSTFDTYKFWDWVREKSKANTVYVSEYVAPEDFRCIWSKELSSSLSNTSKQSKEKLFVYGK